jgi:isopenicillin N synthase-like dioxygenase
LTENPIRCVDLSPIVEGGLESTDARHVLSQIRVACSEIGFMTVTGHGVSPDRIEAVEQAARRFFELPSAAKHAVAPRPWNADSGHRYRGYFPSSANGKEGLDIGDPRLDASRPDLLERPYCELNQRPHELEIEWSHSVRDYFDALSTLGRTLMEAMVASLGGDSSAVAHTFSRPESLSTLRFNGYPVLTEPVEVSRDDGAKLACETHVDSGLVTILYQGERGGLQVRDRQRTWHDVPVDRHAFVVNTGSALEAITAGQFPATRHRVLMGDGPRLSIPFFFEPRYDCQLVPSSFGLSGAPTSEAVTYEAFLRRSLAKFPEYDRESRD